MALRPAALMRTLGVPAADVVERLARLTGRQVGLALMYHGIGERGDPERELVPAFDARLFADQLRHLGRRYRLVRASELQQAARSRRRGERFPVAVTFDDDDRSHVATALPLLKTAGAPATFFLSGASLDRPHRFWFERLGPALAERPDEVRGLLGEPLARAASIHELSEGVQRLPEAERDAFSDGLEALAGPDPPDQGLRAEHVRELAEAGCEIGFHTLRHHGLPSLEDASLQRELREGRERLAEAAGHDAGVLAYPHGLVDERVAAAAREAAFACAFTTVPEAVRPDSDPLLLGRLVPSSSSLGHFALQLARRLIPRPGNR
jgi:peptidoglycan/xylan/chitin deacetylase (PgdA/CDA1 family)